MRIGVFTDTYTPEVNGVVTVIRQMDRELRRAGHEVLIFCPKHPAAPAFEEGVFRFPSVSFIFYKGMRAAFPFGRKAFRALPTLDVIHSHDPGPVGLLGLWASEHYDIPHVHTYHDLYIDYRRYLPWFLRPSRAMVMRISRRIGDRFDATIAPSKEMKKELESYGMRGPIHALPFGLDEEEFSREPRWNARLRLGFPVEDLILYAGRVAEEKNLDLLVRAFGRVMRERPAARLIIAGDGPHRRTLEKRVAELGLARFVRFTGFLDRHDLIDLYKQVDLFAFPSTTDTQGLVVMEAMMAGAAVVAANVLGPVDAIRHGETGLLVNAEEREFAEACLRLLADQQARITMGLAARQYAHENTAAVSTRRLIEIYDSCIGEKRAGARRVAAGPR